LPKKWERVFLASLKTRGNLRSSIIYSCTLPFPPSVNSLFGGGSAQKRFPSKKYKDWRASCPRLDPLGISTPCLVRYTFWLPDNRKRDLSNYLKAPEDYLVSQRVLVDDNHEIVAGVLLEFGGVDKANARVEIDIIDYICHTDFTRAPPAATAP
jgi:crossover junction endodeoxyribonuclease RusA